MLHETLQLISSVDTAWIYVILFFFSFIENIFPPSPSDVVVIVGASLIASTSIAYVPILFITSIGSAVGFILMYYIGKLFGDKVIKTGKLKFLTDEDISRADLWFTKYGYKLIVANRFLPGTRSVISFFSGMYELELYKTFMLASASAFVWNAIIIFVGMQLGNNVELIDYYLSTYSTIAISISVLVIAVLITRYIFKKKKQ